MREVKHTLGKVVLGRGKEGIRKEHCGFEVNDNNDSNTNGTKEHIMLINTRQQTINDQKQLRTTKDYQRIDTNKNDT